METLKLEVDELESAKSREMERADHAQDLLTSARTQLIQVWKECNLSGASEFVDSFYPSRSKYVHSCPLTQ